MRTPARSLATSLVIASVAGLCAVQSADAQFFQVWQLGIDNNNNTEFAQEGGSSNAAPGSAAVKDDDWYFAGQYAGPIGTVAQDEPHLNFERALVTTDPVSRIHFNLPTNLTLDGTEFRLLIDTVSNNSGVPTNPIPFTIQFNGVAIFSGEVSQIEQFFTTPSFFIGTGVGQVLGTTGDNVITLSRSTNTGAGWMQFDYIRLETTTVPEPSTALSFAAGSLLLGFARRRK